MPPSQVILSVEFTMIFAGLALLWQQVLSPAARAATGPSPLPKWDLPLVNFFLFLWVTFITGMGGQFLVLGLLRLATPSPDTRLICASVGFQVGLLAGCLGFRKISSLGPPVAGASWIPRPVSPALAGAATFLIALPLVTFLMLAWQSGLERLGIPAERQDLVELFTHARSPALTALLTVVAVVLAPIAEEWIFRAGLFRYARHRLPRWAALLGPACLFGALHGNLGSFAPLVLLGVVFSLAYERTGRIAVPMIAHGLFNLNTILLLYAGLPG